jgi:hypothetical protein
MGIALLAERGLAVDLAKNVLRAYLNTFPAALA